MAQEIGQSGKRNREVTKDFRGRRSSWWSSSVTFRVAGAILGEAQVSLFVSGAVLGEVQVSPFVAGAVLGEVQVSLFGRRILREAQASLFVAGAVLGEIWKVSRSAKCCIFHYKMLLVSVKNTLGCEAGCGLTGSFSDHGRIILGSAAHCKWRFSCFQSISVRFWVVILRGRRFIWWHWRVSPVAPRIVNDVSYVAMITPESYFWWQAQYLVTFQDDFCCSAPCK